MYDKGYILKEGTEEGGTMKGTLEGTSRNSLSRTCLAVKFDSLFVSFSTPLPPLWHTIKLINRNLI